MGLASAFIFQSWARKFWKFSYHKCSTLKGLPKYGHLPDNTYWGSTPSSSLEKLIDSTKNVEKFDGPFILLGFHCNLFDDMHLQFWMIEKSNITKWRIIYGMPKEEFCELINKLYESIRIVTAIFLFKKFFFNQNNKITLSWMMHHKKCYLLYSEELSSENK